MTAWGPFTPGLPWDERKAQLRSLRTAVRLLTGERGRECGFALIRLEIAGTPEPGLMEAAQREFNRLGTTDQRRVLASFAAVNRDRLPKAE